MLTALSFFIECDIGCGIKYLLDNGLVEFNAIDSHGATPLMIATKAGAVECLKMLLEKGATPTKDDGSLIYAACKGYVGCL